MKKIHVLVSVMLITLLFSGLASAQGISNLPGGGWWSGQQVQNVGTGNATVVIAAYSKTPSVAPIEAQRVLAPGEAFTFSPFAGLTGLPSGFQGSAVVSADQPIKAIVNVTNLKVGTVGVDGGLAAAQYQGFDGGSVDTVLYFPLAKGDYYGATTTFYVQNAGSAAANFTAVFKMNNGVEYTYNGPSVQPNRMAIFSVFDAPGYDKGTSLGGAVRLGALKVTSTQSMAGVVMEHKTANLTAVALFGTRGFTANDFDTKAYAPVIKNNYYNQFTGLQVQNVSASPINVTVTYKVIQGPQAGQTLQETASNVQPGASRTFVQLTSTGSPLNANSLAAATIQATGNFVAIVNEQNAAGTVGITYSAIPDKTATNKVGIPLFKDMFYNSTSGLQIQNVSGAAATVNVAFKCTTQASATYTADSKPQTVAAGSSVLFYRPATSGSALMATPMQQLSNCSATVTANQKVVAIVNEMGLGSNASLDNNNYEGFNLQP